MIQYMKLGQNPSLGSRNRVQTSIFFVIIWHSKCWFDLENKVKVTNIYSFHSYVQMVFLCKFGQNSHQLIQEIECTQGSFLVFIVWCSWKLGQGHQKLITFLNYPSITIYEVWSESVIWFKRQDADKHVLVKIWKCHNACVTLKMRSRSPKSNHLFPLSQ